MAPLARPRDREIRTGTSTFALLTTSVNATFSTPMPSSDYEVYYRYVSGVAVNIPTTSAKTANGFTSGISVGVASTVAWIAVENV